MVSVKEEFLFVFKNNFKNALLYFNYKGVRGLLIFLYFRSCMRMRDILKLYKTVCI